MKLYRRRQFHNDVSVDRITPEEVRALIERRQEPYIVDLRHPLDMLTDPRVIPGAIRMTPDELSRRQNEIPRDREIILYCTCPDEASSASMALKLRTMGITHVRPLLGGFAEWKRRGYALEDALGRIGWRSTASSA